MALPLAGLVTLAVNSYRAVSASKAVAGAAGAALQTRLVQQSISRNPGQLPSNGGLGGTGQTISQRLAERSRIENYLQKVTGESGLIMKNQTTRAGLQAADQKYINRIGPELLEAAKQVRNDTIKEALRSVPKAAAEAAAVGALATGGAIIIGRNNPDGPYKPRPRPGPRQKDPYRPDPSRPGEEEEEEENNDDTNNSTSCVDDSGDMPVGQQEEKTEITMYTPYGTLSTIR